MCFIGVGYYVYCNFRNRKLYFASLVHFCDHLSTEIGFSKRTISQIIDTYIDGYSMQFAGNLRNYRDMLDRHEDLTADSIVLWERLNKAEADVIRGFLMELGRHSVTEELDKIRKARNRFELYLNEAADKLKRDASIYLKICILLGVGVVIVLL